MVTQERALDGFDPQGIYLGHLSLPAGIRISPRPVFKDGRMYAVAEDELGVQHVVRLSIVRGDV